MTEGPGWGICADPAGVATPLRGTLPTLVPEPAAAEEEAEALDTWGPLGAAAANTTGGASVAAEVAAGVAPPAGVQLLGVAVFSHALRMDVAARTCASGSGGTGGVNARWTEEVMCAAVTPEADGERRMSCRAC